MITSETLRKLSILNLSPEQMAGVLSLLADGLEKEEQRKQKQNDRKRKQRDCHGTVTGQEQESHVLPSPLIPPSDGFPDPSLTPPYNPPIQKTTKRESVILPDWMPLAEWNGFKEMRNKIKKPMTDRAQRLAIGKLEKFRAQGHDPTEILNQSIFSDYQDLYEPKEKTNAKHSGNTTKPKSWTGAGQELAAKYGAEADREEQTAISNFVEPSLRLTESLRQEPRRD